jgi:hypothetical protein
MRDLDLNICYLISAEESIVNLTSILFTPQFENEIKKKTQKEEKLYYIPLCAKHFRCIIY